MSTSSERLQRYIDAETGVLEGQKVRFGDRELTMADLSEIRAAINELRRDVANESAGSGGGFKAVQFGDSACSD